MLLYTNLDNILKDHSGRCKTMCVLGCFTILPPLDDHSVNKHSTSAAINDYTISGYDVFQRHVLKVRLSLRIPALHPYETWLEETRSAQNDEAENHKQHLIHIEKQRITGRLNIWQGSNLYTVLKNTELIWSTQYLQSVLDIHSHSTGSQNTIWLNLAFKHITVFHISLFS